MAVYLVARVAVLDATLLSAFLTLYLDEMSPSVHRPDAGFSFSSLDADDKTGRSRPGFVNAGDNPFGTHQPPPTLPVATNPTNSFCWSLFSRQESTQDRGAAITASSTPGRQNRDESTNDSFTISPTSIQAHDAGSINPGLMYGSCVDTSDHYENYNVNGADISSPFSSPLSLSRGHGSNIDRMTIQAAPCSSQGLVDDSSQISVGAGTEGVFDSSPVNNNITSSPITDPNSSQQGSVSLSLSSMPMVGAGEGDLTDIETQTTSSLDKEDQFKKREEQQQEEDSPLARYARYECASSPFSLMDEDAVDDEVEGGFIDLDAQDGYTADILEETTARLPRHASPYQRILTRKDDEIADLTRRYERLETAVRFCRCGGKGKAASQPRDERGRWMSLPWSGSNSDNSSSSSSSRVDKNKNKNNMMGKGKGSNRRRKTELELTLATAWRFGYPVEGVLGQRHVRKDLVVGGARVVGLGCGGDGGSLVGRRITGEIWSRWRGGVGGGV